VKPEAETKATERAERKLRRAERREEKAARKAEKAARKEQRRAHDGRHRDDSPPHSRTPARHLHDSRSPSPKRYRPYDLAGRDELRDGGYRRSRSRGRHSPVGGRFRDRSTSPYHRHQESDRHSLRQSYQPLHSDRYDDAERGRERARDRQRWDHNVRRQTSGGDRWGRT
jgi:hypothetical protein